MTALGRAGSPRDAGEVLPGRQGSGTMVRMRGTFLLDTAAGTELPEESLPCFALLCPGSCCLCGAHGQRSSAPCPLCSQLCCASEQCSMGRSSAPLLTAPSMPCNG